MKLNIIKINFSYTFNTHLLTPIKQLIRNFRRRNPLISVIGHTTNFTHITLTLSSLEKVKLI